MPALGRMALFSLEQSYPSWLLANDRARRAIKWCRARKRTSMAARRSKLTMQMRLSRAVAGARAAAGAATLEEVQYKWQKKALIAFNYLLFCALPARGLLCPGKKYQTHTMILALVEISELHFLTFRDDLILNGTACCCCCCCCCRCCCCSR